LADDLGLLSEVFEMDCAKSLFCSACRMLPVLAIFVFGTTYADAAQVYKWVDEKGEVHYSDKVPAGKKWTIMDDAPISVVPSDVPKAPVSSPRPSTAAAEKGGQASSDRALADRREKRLKECEKNRGVDCAIQVDTELEAEAIQGSGRVIHQAPPRPATAPR
jgi:hypothetical protein